MRYYCITCLIFNRLTLGADAVEGNGFFEVVESVVFRCLLVASLTVLEVIWSLN